MLEYLTIRHNSIVNEKIRPANKKKEVFLSARRPLKLERVPTVSILTNGDLRDGYSEDYPNQRSPKREREKRRVRFALPPPGGGGGGGGPPAPLSPRLTRRRGADRSGVAVGVAVGTVRSLSSDPLSRGASPSRANRSAHQVPREAAAVTETAGVRQPVAVAVSPAVRDRVYPTGRYLDGTLSPTTGAAPEPPSFSACGRALVRAARDADDHQLAELLRKAAMVGLSRDDLNAVDSSGRTVVSYVASNGSIELLEQLLELPGVDPNKPDNEGNTPLHFAAQAGQIECLNCLLSRCKGIDIDARNNLGFTALMKAALQGRNKCAKLLLFAGANPTLRDQGRGFRADQWARFCGRYACADAIERHARQRLLERSTAYGRWGGDDQRAAVIMGKVMPVPRIPQQPEQTHGIKSRLRKVFRTSSGPDSQSDALSSARLVTQLTSAALCASSPVLPSGGSVPPVVKSLIRPLTVPRLQITLVNNNGECPAPSVDSGRSTESGRSVDSGKSVDSGRSVESGRGFDSVAEQKEELPPGVRPARTKKKK